MQRTRDEFPERLELLEYCPVRVVIVRCRIVHVGGQPHRIPDAGALHERQQAAISFSRRSGGPSPSAIASSLIKPIGRSAAITFQVASDAKSSRFSQASWVGPKMKVSPPSLRLFHVESR